MKKTLVIVIISLFSLSCFGQNSLQEIKNDSLISQFFNERDLNSLLLIVNLYDNWVMSHTGIEDIDSAYHGFLENAKYNETFEEFDKKISLPQNQLDSILISCENNRTFRKLWNYEFSKKDGQIDTFLVELVPNLGWIYGEFLNELVNENEILISYLESAKTAGDIVPSSAIGLPNIHESFDFKEIHWRLFHAIHFVTVSYSVSFHKTNP